MVLVLGLLVSAGCGNDEDVASPTQVQQEVDSNPETERVLVPDVEKLRVVAAQRALERRGLRARVEREHSTEIEEGLVLAQDPQHGKKVVPSTLVILVVSKGPKPDPEPTGPFGALGTSSVGPVRVGMDASQVEALFGPPHRTEEVNFGEGPTPQEDWIWDLGGEFRLNFESAGGTVTGYSSSTASLSTASGYTIGDSFAPMQAEYGDQLRPAPFGTDSYLLSEGEPGTMPALTFYAPGDIIQAISGGEFQAAGE